MNKPPGSDPFMKGFSWGFPGQRGEFAHPESLESLRAMRDLGVEWVTICFGARMDSLEATEIAFGDAEETMVTDDEIRHAVGQARALGLRVVLKPMVETREGVWRGLIKHASEADLAVWWQSFEAFLVHYAHIAEECGCDMFCLGCEMGSMEPYADRWRKVTSAVRGVFSGRVTYNANHDRVWDVAWWDAVDIISISAYYPVGRGADSTVAEMQASWVPVRKKLAALAQASGKPVFFIEIGMMSAEGCSLYPHKWDSDAPYAPDEQARFYEAALSTFWEDSWFAGFFWWKWDARPSLVETASKNSRKAKVVGERGFRISGKPAEATLRRWYARPRVAAEAAAR